MKVLFLSAWYPNRNDAMFGLFVRKHAQAIALYTEVAVLYVQHDCLITDFDIIVEKKGNLTEIIIYYPCKKNIFFFKILKTINYLRAYLKGFNMLTSLNYKPDIIHVNVLTRTAVIAWLMKVLKKTPYVVTEHWTRYLPTHNEFNGLIHKWITRFVVRKAKVIMPVSIMLQNAMLKHSLYNINYQIIDNVIDPAFLSTYPIQERSKSRLILVTCFDERAKNVNGIIRVIHKLSQQRNDFELVVIGDGIDFKTSHQLSNELNLTDNFIFFEGEKTSTEVAEAIANSDCMLLFSNYETASIVITESLAMGKPVISTLVGIAPEYIDKVSGLLINIGDENALFENISFMLDNKHEYDNDLIKSKFKNKFTYETIGNKIIDVYKSAIY